MLRGLLLLGLIVPLAGGCAAVAAAGVVGVGVVQYSRNQAEQDFAANLEQAWEAVQEGLRRLEITPEESALTKTEGYIASGDLRVQVERHPEGFTRVRVRVGTFYSQDHERRARILLQEIASAIESQDDLRAWVEQTEAPPRTKKSRP